MRAPAALTFIAMAAAAAALHAQTPASTQESGQTVTVTARSVGDFRARLAACLARHCPVNEDVDATMALAEALDLDGDYANARIAVNQSLSRNHRLAASYPEPVADLYRAQARISRQLGFDDQAARSTDRILRALQTGIPQEDYRHFTARLERAEVQMSMHNVSQAKRELVNLERIARAAGREDIAALAELRRLWFDLVADPLSSSRHRLQELAALQDPAQRMRAIGARVLLARLARAEGDNRRADTLLAELGQLGNDQHRVLISAPQYELAQQEQESERDSLSEAIRFGNIRNRQSENFNGKWIDVGFWVSPDGHVSGLEVVRRGAPEDWAAPLLTSIRNRLYSRASESTYRLERYTYTAAWSDFSHQETGSHLRVRSPAARVEFLDLTTNIAPPPAAADGLAPSGPGR